MKCTYTTCCKLTQTNDTERKCIAWWWRQQVSSVPLSLPLITKKGRRVPLSPWLRAPPLLLLLFCRMRKKCSHTHAHTHTHMLGPPSCSALPPTDPAEGSPRQSGAAKPPEPTQAERAGLQEAACCVERGTTTSYARSRMIDWKSAWVWKLV